MVTCIAALLYFYIFCVLPLWDHIEHITVLSNLFLACYFIFFVHPIREKDPPSTIFNISVKVWSGSPYPCTSHPKSTPTCSGRVTQCLPGWKPFVVVIGFVWQWLWRWIDAPVMGCHPHQLGCCLVGTNRSTYKKVYHYK